MTKMTVVQLADSSSPAGYVIGTGGLAFVGLYVLSLLGIGWMGHLAKRAHTLEDHYLGGRNFGIGVLFLTLYATQYSGNSFMGFVGKAYRSGFPFLSGVAAMMAVIGGYFIFAPKLHRWAHRRRFLTLGDYVQDRFRWRPLTVFVVLLGVFALGNYVLTNLKALGILAETVSGGRVSFEVAVVLLAAVMLTYETLGGMRSVAWTDVLQGLVLLVSLAFIAFALFFRLGGPEGVAEGLEAARPDIWNAPSPAEKVTWMSSVLLFFFGISMYPHAIQRIYAARDEATLRRSLQLMVFMPLITTLLLVLLGVMAIAVLPGLGRTESDSTTLLMVGELVRELPALMVMGPILVAAVVAATMSTIDSALLAISSMVSNDLYRPMRPGRSETHLTRIGKLTSFALMISVVVLTIALKEQTIWRLLEIKLEVLSQVAPAVMLGLHWRRLTAVAVFCGVAAGTLVAVALSFGAFGLGAKPLGVHAGIWGLGLNLLVLVVVQAATNRGRTGTPCSAR